MIRVRWLSICRLSRSPADSLKRMPVQSLFSGCGPEGWRIFPSNSSGSSSLYFSSTRNRSSVLTFGGFSFNGGGTGDRMNQSFETYDPAVWDANHAADPWTVLTQHEEGDIATTPTRGYPNIFLLPQPVPARSSSRSDAAICLLRSGTRHSNSSTRLRR